MMKYKTIKISESLHDELKKFCVKYGLKLNQSCELWLKSHMLLAAEYDKDFKEQIKPNESK